MISVLRGRQYLLFEVHDRFYIVFAKPTFLVDKGIPNVNHIIFSDCSFGARASTVGY